MSARVRQEPKGELIYGKPLGCKIELAFIVQQCKNKKWKVYESEEGYSAVSGGFTIKRHVMRDTDNTIFQFNTLKAAEDWIKNGCRVSLN